MPPEFVPPPDKIPGLSISPFWIGLMVAVIVMILMNIVTIVLGSLAIETANSIGKTYNLLKTNVANNNINTGTDCMSCDLSGDPDGSYKLTIESVMNNNPSSPTGLTQFSPNGIEIDNILFTDIDSSSTNSNTNILFENNLGASQNLVASVPGFITVPISSLTSFQLTQYCSSFTSEILFTYYISGSTSFNLCTCTSQFQKCINLT